MYVYIDISISINCSFCVLLAFTAYKATCIVLWQNASSNQICNCLAGICIPSKDKYTQKHLHIPYFFPLSPFHTHTHSPTHNTQHTQTHTCVSITSSKLWYFTSSACLLYWFSLPPASPQCKHLSSGWFKGATTGQQILWYLTQGSVSHMM